MRERPDTRSIWIHSARDDLIWFQGSVLAGIALLAFFAWTADSANGQGSYPLLVGVFLWGAIFDGTHVWATYARSYLAPEETSRAGIPGRWSWLLLLAGPAVALASWESGVAGLFQLFLLAAYLWAYWHLVRQHYGFMMLYRRRANQLERRGSRLDEAILWAGCLYPFLRFSLSDAYSHSGLPLLVPAMLVSEARHLVDLFFGFLGLGLAALVLTQAVEKLTIGPKHLLMALVILFHIAVFSLLHNLLAILATLTIFHNIQYHRIVWMHERGLGRIPSGGVVPYLAFGLALGVGWYGLRVFGTHGLGAGLAGNMLVGFCWGIAFHHYLVDGRIWRTRRSPTLARALLKAIP